MKDLIISLEATGDLTPEIIKKYNLKIVNMPFMVDGEEYSTETDTVVSACLYEKMRAGKKTQTSQVNEQTYEEFFEKLINEDKPILHIAFSSGLSNTYLAAKATAEKLNKKLKKELIYVVDSLCACSGHGMLAILAKEYSKKAKDILDVIKYVEKTKNVLCHSFTVDSLKYLANGGRIKQSSAFIGNILNIKPIMHMDEFGKLTVLNKVISRKKSLISIYNKFKANRNKNNDLVFISHADCIKDAEFIANLIKENEKIDPIITNLGPVIGCHSGPGTLAVFYLSSER